jgi:hypothetical protein
MQGKVAVSLMSKKSFAERIAAFGRPTESAILMWNFRDLLHPELILESPFDVTAFDINPSDPNLVVAGCFNGQVVLWEIGDPTQVRLAFVARKAQCRAPVAGCNAWLIAVRCCCGQALTWTFPRYIRYTRSIHCSVFQI